MRRQQLNHDTSIIRPQKQFKSRISEIIENFESQLYEQQLKTIAVIQQQPTQQLRMLILQQVQLLTNQLKYTDKQNLHKLNIDDAQFNVPLIIQRFAFKNSLRIISQKQGLIVLQKQNRAGLFKSMLAECFKNKNTLIFSVKWSANRYVLKLQEGQLEWFNEIELCFNSHLKTECRVDQTQNLLEQQIYKNSAQSLFRFRSEKGLRNLLRLCRYISQTIQQKIEQERFHYIQYCQIQKVVYEYFGVQKIFQGFYHLEQKSYSVQKEKIDHQSMCKLFGIEEMPPIQASLFSKCTQFFNKITSSPSIQVKCLELVKYNKYINHLINNQLFNTDVILLNVFCLLRSSDDLYWNLKLIQQYCSIKDHLELNFANIQVAVDLVLSLK